MSEYLLCRQCGEVPTQLMFQSEGDPVEGRAGRVRIYNLIEGTAETLTSFGGAASRVVRDVAGPMLIVGPVGRRERA